MSTHLGIYLQTWSHLYLTMCLPTLAIFRRCEWPKTYPVFLILSRDHKELISSSCFHVGNWLLNMIMVFAAPLGSDIVLCQHCIICEHFCGMRRATHKKGVYCYIQHSSNFIGINMNSGTILNKKSMSNIFKDQ